LTSSFWPLRSRTLAPVTSDLIDAFALSLVAMSEGVITLL
jgi:hypothetical protein